MKTFCLLLLIAVAMEKSNGEYLLVEIDEKKVPTPRECCEASDVPEFCLGLCSPPGVMARQEKRLTACSQYDAVIEKCFQGTEPKLHYVPLIKEDMGISARIVDCQQKCPGEPCEKCELCELCSQCNSCSSPSKVCEDCAFCTEGKNRCSRCCGY